LGWQSHRDKYLKSFTETKDVPSITFLPNIAFSTLPTDNKNRVANAKGVKYLSKLRGIIFMLSL
jgi:hypothetical protein